MEEKQGSFKPWHLAALATGLWAYFEWKFVDVKQEIKKNIREPGLIVPENEGKPVLASGIVNSSGDVEEKLFNLKVGCLRLDRSLKEYQSTWGPCQGPVAPWLHPESNFSSTSFEIAPFSIPAEAFKAVPAELSLKVKVLPKAFRDVILGKGFAVYSDESSYYLSRFKRKSGVYKPVKGDYQVSFDYLPKSQYFTVFGQQEGEKISPYKSPNLPSPVLIVKPGFHSLDSMLDDLPKQDKSTLYVLRALASGSVFMSLFMSFYSNSLKIPTNPISKP